MEFRHIVLSEFTHNGVDYEIRIITEEGKYHSKYYIAGYSASEKQWKDYTYPWRTIGHAFEEFLNNMAEGMEME